MNRIAYSADTTLTIESMGAARPAFTKSIFTSHTLHPGKFRVIENHHSQPDWILALFLSGFILLAWTNFFYFNRLKQMILAPFSKRFLSQLIREGNLFTERNTLVLGVVYLLSFSLLLYQVNVMILGISFRNLPGILVYIIITGALVVFWLLKTWMIRFLGSVFKTPSTTYYYQINLVIFAALQGLVILPLLVCVIYLKSLPLLIICLAISALLFLFRFLKGFFIGLTLTKFSYLFLFVYLCSLEILPLLILIKLVMMASQTTRA
ncbi:MAG: DUF4271 domain-containing protein [bacterium]